MDVLVSIGWTNWTEEDIEFGEPSERGSDTEIMSMRDLLTILQTEGYTASCTNPNRWTWYTTIITSPFSGITQEMTVRPIGYYPYGFQAKVLRDFTDNQAQRISKFAN